MALGPQYCKQIREELRRHANFPPNRPLALGDYGTVRDHVFERLGNVAQLGLSVEANPGSGESSFVFKSRGSVSFELVAKGEIQPGGVPAAKAAIELRFSRENAVFFAASGCRVTGVKDLKALEEDLLGLVRQERWETDYYVVTEVYEAARTTAVASSDRDSEIRIEAESPALETIRLGDASLELEVKRSRNVSLEIVTAHAQTPLMQLSRLRGIFRDELRPEALSLSSGRGHLRLQTEPDTVNAVPTVQELASAASASFEESETAPFLAALGVSATDFEIDRAISVYIRLLRACYEFSHGNPNPQLPDGFEEVGRVVAREDLSLSVENLDPVARQAVENDFAALDREARSGGEGLALDSIPNPEAFGFVVRDRNSGDLIVGIRGTQTPEEWVANFTAIPNSFNEVPGFGAVHLGFERMWRKVRASVATSLAPLPSAARITFLGHSLGGAMAVLGAVDAKSNFGKTNVDVCTLGGPRVGKIRFRVNFNNLIERCFRVTNQGDVVPHVPSVITAWNHTGTEIEVNGRRPNPHSLDSYLAGLENLGGGLALSSPARIIGARTL